MIYCADTRYSSDVFENIQDIGETHINRDVWAFAYEEDERALNLKCKPIMGQIKGDRHFYEFKVNGQGLKKNGVSIYARYYADTYEEAVAGFNMLVQRRIDSLKEEVSNLEDMLIEY